MKSTTIGILSIAAFFTGGCSNLQTEYEKQATIIGDQKTIIQELSKTNEYLKGRHLNLEAELKKAKLRSDYNSRIGDLSSTYEQKLEQMIQNLNRQLDSSLSNISGVSRHDTSEGTMIRMSEAILFRSGSATLSDSGKDVLKKVTDVLKNYPDRRVRVDGHSDSDPIRKTKDKYSSNWDLSATRAVRVVEELTAKSGIPGDRVFAAAFSQYQPIDPSDKSLNRRVEIVVLNN